ncbi:MAG: DUF3489 domain-containing protein [Bauldia sp.]|nr:DUF3489 domain-containing protein [Bauldia sp.]
MTTKLSDTQLVILSTACGRDDRLVFPITASLKGGALNKVLQSLLAKGYIEETEAEAGSTVWRDDEGPLTLRATHAAAVALGIESEPETPAAAEVSQAAAEPAATEEATPPHAAREPAGGPANDEAADAPPEPSSAPTEPTSGEEGPKVRAGTKQALLIEMLRRPEGATIDEVIAATGWQAHTVRGAMAGALKKKLGLDIKSEKVEGRGRVYSIVDGA